MILFLRQPGYRDTGDKAATSDPDGECASVRTIFHRAHVEFIVDSRLREGETDADRK